MKDFSLLILPCLVELCGGQLDPDAGRRLSAYRLVHEQECQDRDVRWYFLARMDLSKPEALARAQAWYASTRHPDWPGFSA